MVEIKDKILLDVLGEFKRFNMEDNDNQQKVSDSYTYIVDLITERFENKNQKDKSLSLYDYHDILNMLDDMELKWTDALWRVIEFLQKK